MKKSDKIEQLKEQFSYNQSVFEETKKTVGEKLLEIRKINDYTQQEVADIIGISRSALSYYEKGERAIDIVTLHKLSYLYNVSTDYLLGTKDTPNTQNDYGEKIELKRIGFSEKALDHLAGTPDTVDLINDLILHRNFQELEYLTHYSRYTRYESMDAGYRSFLTSKLLYSMISDIYEQWYIDNDERISPLSKEEKEELLRNVQVYLTKHKMYDSLNSAFPHSPHPEQLILSMEDMYENMSALYKKLANYL